MPVNKLSIVDFLHCSVNELVLDVRSPAEFNQAHIPGAYSLPLFTDEERKIVGTAYKQKSREQAIKTGVDFFGPKMRIIIETVEALLKSKAPNSKNIFIHCWRGGMRSGAVAWLLDLYGFNVSVLVGGYKAYRNWVLQHFEKDYPIKILGGFTGSGKTPILLHLEQCGEKVIDLEALARHKGSAFGGIGQPAQPRQEMFENLLAQALHNLSNEKMPEEFWIEDESQRIGVLNIPPGFWEIIRTKKVFFIDIPFDERLKYIVQEYGSLEKEKIKEAVFRIQKRLGPLETKMTIAFIEEDNFTEAFKILLQYYDKFYLKALHNREHIDNLLLKISCNNVHPAQNAKNILACETLSV